MKLTVLTAAAVLGATAAFAQTTAPGSPAGTMTSPTPGAMPSTESMTQPPAETTGPSAANDAMTEQAARQKLAGAGYGSVSNLKRTPDGQWEATTKNGSKQQRVTIAPDGSVTPKSPQ